MTDITITTAERAGRQTASSGSKWEPIMGYSRAVRAGNQIAVTGSVGINADGTYSRSLGEQTRRSLDIIRAAVPAIVVPFDENGDTEQTVRARRLQQLDLVRVVRAGAGARALAEAITTIRPQSRAGVPLDLEGGQRSTEILVSAVRGPFVQRVENEGELT